MWKISQMICMGILVSLSIVDIHFRKIPVDILILANLAVVVYQLAIGKADIWLVAGGAGLGVLFLVFSRVTRESMGYGDSWAILILGIYLGIWDLIEVLAVSFFTLTIVSVICMVRKRRYRRSVIPFYPFLTVGYLFSLLAGGASGW